MSDEIKIELAISFNRQGPGARRVASTENESDIDAPQGRLPKITKLMALAVRFEKLLADGVVPDYAELARLGHVTRARLTQIMNLRLLAPDIQEAILFANEIFVGRDPISLRQLQPIALTADWKKQRRLWKRLSSESGPNVSTSPE